MSPVGFALVVLLAWAYLFGATVATLRFARRVRRESGVRTGGGRSISVLKPLYGAEPGLHENLLSFADQDHPVFQLVLGVRDPADGALPVARAVIAERPQCDIAIVIDPHAAGSNLKVANLENMLPATRHELLVIADSRVRVTPDYLGAVTAPLSDPETGIVTCLYRGVPDRGLWSQLLALHINFGFMPSALVAEALGIGGGCFGATIALRREVLERIGGFTPLRDELADDHRIGAAVRRLGLAIVLSPHLVDLCVVEPSFSELWRHELRWARTARLMAPVGFAGSVVSHTVVLAVLAALISAASIVAWGCVLLSLLLRWLSAMVIARRLDLPTRALWLLPLRDALSFAVFVGSLCGRDVVWRGRLLRVGPHGEMSVEGNKPA